MSSLRRKLALGLKISAIGFLLVLVPQIRSLEQEIGLSILFMLRDQQDPPSDVLIITLDKDSAQHFNFPAEPDMWPRSLHAELVDSLISQGVKAIAFDLHFKRPQSLDNDQLFAAAMQRAGNVVLCECLKTEKLQIGMHTAQIEKPDPPLQVLQKSASAVSPFPLPKVPARVFQYWTFKTSAGDKPTLPVAAFQVFAIEYYNDFFDLLKKFAPDQVRNLPTNTEDILTADNLLPTIGMLREVFIQDPSLSPKMLKELSRSQDVSNYDERGHQILRALIKMYQSPESPFLNYYGAAGTMTTVPYYQNSRPSSGPPKK
ncbi:MAG: CHASE2 domain-containing protein [Desulfovermiculus sp.]